MIIVYNECMVRVSAQHTQHRQHRAQLTGPVRAAAGSAVRAAPRARAIYGGRQLRARTCSATPAAHLTDFTSPRRARYLLPIIIFI